MSPVARVRTPGQVVRTAVRRYGKVVGKILTPLFPLCVFRTRREHGLRKRGRALPSAGALFESRAPAGCAGGRERAAGNRHGAGQRADGDVEWRSR